MPMANVNGSMIEVKQYPKRGSHIWYRNYFYVNLCTRDHDNSSCTDLQNRADETGRYIKETVSLVQFLFLQFVFFKTRRV